MKATRFFLMIALVSFALMSFATNDSDRPMLKVKISIEKASHNPGLAQAIYQQVDQSIMGNDTPAFISAEVKYNRTIYVVYGTHSQWLTFFTIDRTISRTVCIDF